MNGTHTKSEVLKVKWWVTRCFSVNRKFRSPSLPAVEPYSLRIWRIGIWDFSRVLGIYMVKVPPLPSIQLRSKPAHRIPSDETLAPLQVSKQLPCPHWHAQTRATGT